MFLYKLQALNLALYLKIKVLDHNLYLSFFRFGLCLTAPLERAIRQSYLQRWDFQMNKRLKKYYLTGLINSSNFFDDSVVI